MLNRLLAHPMMLCGFRPFFALAALAAVLGMGWWLAALLFGLPVPDMPGGPVLWHVQGMVFGVTLAAIIGFALTAVPEFTGAAPVPRPAVLELLALWLLGRLAGTLVGWVGVWPVMFFDVALVLRLISRVGPMLWRDRARAHRSILWALLLWLVVSVGFYVDLLRGEWAMRWLHGAIGVVMALIVLVMSRVSMRIVNTMLDELGETATRYLARPPRRHLAVSCIALFTLADLFAPGAPVGGWLALATAAALANLLNDWHLGRVLLRRWVAVLYAVYALMALGYAQIGLAMLADIGSVSGGRHLLTIGALGLSIFVIMNIAGRIHTGRELDTRAWIPLCAGLLVGAALVRGGLYGAAPLLMAGGLWMAAFGLFLWGYLPLYLQPRPDGGQGCEGVLDAPSD